MFGAFPFGAPYWGQGPASVYVVPTVVPVTAIDAASTPVLTADGAVYAITVAGVQYAFVLPAAHTPTATLDAQQDTIRADGAVES